MSKKIYFANNKFKKSEFKNPLFLKEDLKMSGNKNLMSENLKTEIAKELGVYEAVKRDGGWGNVSSKHCGSMISKAIEIANRSV